MALERSEDEKVGTEGIQPDRFETPARQPEPSQQGVHKTWNRAESTGSEGYTVF